MKLHTIDTGLFKLDGGAMFGVVPRSMWERLTTPDSKGMCTWAMRCMLIEDGNKLILIDCGLGNKQDEKFFSHYEPHGEDTLTKSLNKLGFTESDITDVLLTHLHFDHCGGAIKREGDKLIPAFSNATYWSNEKHWDWAIHPNAREKASFLKENILPIQESGQLKFVEDGSTAIHPSVLIKTVSGHTESMLIPHISYKGNTIVYAADLFPSRWHIPIPYVMAYDTRPLLTLEEKLAFLPNAAENNYLLFFEHDPSVELCSLQATERGVKEKECFRLAEIG
jgi:glyoxylase-like metal-dependent hydrolase (beta-lactamase superfamily II)